MKNLFKTISALALLALTALLCGCECAGFNPRGVGEAITPGTGAETTVRTWEKNKDGTNTPVEKEVANPQAFQ